MLVGRRQADGYMLPSPLIWLSSADSIIVTKGTSACGCLWTYYTLNDKKKEKEFTIYNPKQVSHLYLARNVHTFSLSDHSLRHDIDISRYARNLYKSASFELL